MARIAGVDLPARKRAAIGLTYIYGIGRTRSLSLLHRAQVDPDKKVADLSEEEVNHLRNLIVHLDPDFPLAVILYGRRFRRRHHGRIVQRMLPDQPFVRRLELTLRFND